MKLKNIIQEDYSNYKTGAMFLGFPSCTWKCEKDCGRKGLCQNAALALSPTIDISEDEIIATYLANPLSSAVVCGGLEPFDSWMELSEFVVKFRKKSADPIIIYTGYEPEEINYAIQYLKLFSNIIVKFGRFVPDQESHYDEILGVNLASPNQRAERIS